MVATAAAVSTTSTSSLLIRQKYRSLSRLVQRLPEKYDPERSWQELREAFRKPLQGEETVEQRLTKADERMSFLRMITPKSAHGVIDRNNNNDNNGHRGGGKWVYRNGERLENVNGTLRDTTGRVISNWDGKNLDPDSVKRHNHHLKRLGFRNNAHAKGIF